MNALLRPADFFDGLTKKLSALRREFLHLLPLDNAFVDGIHIAVVGGAHPMLSRILLAVFPGRASLDGAELPHKMGKAVIAQTCGNGSDRLIAEGQCQLCGIYPCGEGAGYAGGIVSAAVDGLRVASKIITRYKPY